MEGRRRTRRGEGGGGVKNTIRGLEKTAKSS